MTLTLDPRYPIVWRTPDSLQLGVDNPPFVLESVTLGHERMLAGLAVGLTPAGLTLIGAESGLTERQIEDFRRAIEPALTHPTTPRHTRVVVAGTGHTVDRLGWRLTEAGLDSQQSGPHPDAASAATQRCATDFAVVIAHYALDPEYRGLWLRRDIPHLPVVFGDTSVRIGPMIEPGFGPCLYCLELHRRDADTAWPALASQLLGLRSTAETPYLASEVATIVARMILTRGAGTASATAISLTIDAATGEQARHSLSRHPDCACGGMAGVSGSAPRGIETANSRQNADRSTPPTTTEVSSVPA